MYWYYKLLIGAVIIIILFFCSKPYIAKIEFSSQNSKKDEVAKKGQTKEVFQTYGNGAGQVNNSVAKGSAIDRQIGVIEDLYKKGKYTQALDDGYILLEDPLFEKFTPQWYRLGGIIGKINTKLAFSTIPYSGKTKYKIKYGDSLAKIAKGKTTGEAIAKANGVVGNIIYPERTLSFFAGPWNMVAYKEQFILVVYQNNRFFKYYKIGTGQYNRTPVGNFVISQKIENPPYWHKGRQIPFGDPENPLGTRWMAIKDDNQPDLTGFGIHGTLEPDSIGKESSQGCLRMLNSEVEELFILVPYRTQLIIKD